jgi:hypothetical protein
MENHTSCNLFSSTLETSPPVQQTGQFCESAGRTVSSLI